MKFVWDANKAASNVRKHRIRFDEVVEVFFDPSSVTFPDEMHSTNEARLITIGNSKRSRILLVVHTETNIESNDVIIRIISARRATRTERSTYEES